MPARKRPARKRASSQGKGKRRSRSKKSPSFFLFGLLGLSTAGLVVSLYFLYQEKQKNAEDHSISQKAMELAQKHPDAEVMTLDNPPPSPSPKKKN